MANSTRSQLRTLTNQEIKIDRLYKIWSEAEYNQAIDEALFYINSRGDGKWQMQDQTATGLTTVDQQFYDTPDDYLWLKVVEFNDRALTRVEYDDLVRQYTEFPTGTPTQYCLYKGKICLNPIPTQEGVLKMVYSKKVVNLTTDETESPFANRFDRAVALYAAFILLSQPSDSRNNQRASTKLTRFETELGVLLKMFLYSDRENMRFRSTYIPRTMRGRRYSRNFTH